MSSSGVFTDKNNTLVFENSNCIINYNLWANGGDAGFQIYNKSDQNIYVDMSESFFVLNGVANNYYKDRIYTYTVGKAITKSKGSNSSVVITGIDNNNSINYSGAVRGNAVSTSTVQSISSNEEKIVCIPPMTSKFFTEYKIFNEFISECSLSKYPLRNQLKSHTYNKENTPISFSNRIAYRVGKENEIQRFENSFYATEIANYPEAEVFNWEHKDNCGKQSKLKYKTHKFQSTDRFYILYQR